MSAMENVKKQDCSNLFSVTKGNLNRNDIHLGLQYLQLPGWLRKCRLRAIKAVVPFTINRGYYGPHGQEKWRVIPLSASPANAVKTVENSLAVNFGLTVGSV